MKWLPKQFAVALYCCSRQAERSLHFALSNLGPLRTYYAGPRQTGLMHIAHWLQELGVHGRHRDRREIESPANLHPVTFVCRSLFNQFRSRWRFSCAEIEFLHGTLCDLLDVLRGWSVPDHDYLVELRMDLWYCQCLIGNRLCGVPELRKAVHIEHFRQAGHVPSVTLEDLGIAPGQFRRSA